MRSLQVIFCYSERILFLFFHVGPLDKTLIVLRHLCFINNLKHAINNNYHQMINQQICQLMGQSVSHFIPTGLHNNNLQLQ